MAKVHCFQGISRSATVVAAYVLTASSEPLSGKDALELVRQKRDIVSPNWGFVLQLEKFAASHHSASAQLAAPAKTAQPVSS